MDEAELLMSLLAFFPKTGSTTSRAKVWAKIIAGPAANTEAPNWYTWVGMPEKEVENEIASPFLTC